MPGKGYEEMAADIVESLVANPNFAPATRGAENIGKDIATIYRAVLQAIQNPK